MKIKIHEAIDTFVNAVILGMVFGFGVIVGAKAGAEIAAKLIGVGG